MPLQSRDCFHSVRSVKTSECKRPIVLCIAFTTSDEVRMLQPVKLVTLTLKDLEIRGFKQGNYVAYNQMF